MNEAIQELDQEGEGYHVENVDLPEPPETPELTDATPPQPTEEPEPKPKKKQKSPQERINEVLYQKHKANEERAAAQAENEILTGQNEKLKQELEDLKRAQEARSSTEGLDTQVEALRAQRRTAIQDDDFAKAFEIEDSIRQLERQQKEAAYRPPEPPAEPETPPKEEKQDIPPSAQKWLEANAWYHDPRNNTLAREADYVEYQLRQEGYGFSDALYEELDRRLQQLPEFTPVVQSRPRVAAPPRGGEPPQKPKPNQLSDYDLDIMRKTPNLDPNNPAHRAAYLKYKGK